MMTSEDSKKFISTLKDIFQNGFHNHNNNGTVFANIVELINANIDIVMDLFQVLEKMEEMLI